MSWLFGKPRAQTVAKESITKLKESSLILEKRENYLQTQIDKEVKSAKAHLAKNNKRKALEALKRKKQWEEQINKLANTRLNVDTLLMTIENSKVDLETVKVMKQGAEAMKVMQSEMKIEKVEDAMDDVRDQMANAQTISEALSEPIGSGVDFDEDELLKELEEFESELIDSQLGDAIAPPVFIPQHEQGKFEFLLAHVYWQRLMFK
ncbi:ESCRT-III subunit protein snf7, variant 2 [Entomophthora muscae]|uniref:ESCRT-III subunit protein snf7, variant 2 n=1 Tax=Entomophthora muscae TaxID=34485 RepID=A0ACC2US93_9FUNG|nr:ESCRT-III subunit protein snf7, variant 2 [Entomophthora muscae]